MGVWFGRENDGVSEESEDGDDDEGGVEIPVGEGSGDLLIEGLQKDGHGPERLCPVQGGVYTEIARELVNEQSCGKRAPA